MKSPLCRGLSQPEMILFPPALLRPMMSPRNPIRQSAQSILAGSSPGMDYPPG